MEILERAEVIAALKANKIGVMQTDTVLGIVARYDNEVGIRRIYEIKRRPISKLMPVIVANQKQRDALVKSEPKITTFLAEQKKPTTIVYEKKKSFLPDSQIWTGQTVAVRIVKPRWLKEILEATGPLVATSCNVAEINRETTDLSLIDEKIALIQQVDFWMKSDVAINRKRPSRIYNWAKRSWIRQ